jgi:hypothetical protein
MSDGAEMCEDWSKIVKDHLTRQASILALGAAPWYIQYWEASKQNTWIEREQMRWADDGGQSRDET